MSNRTNGKLLEKMADILELPDSAYEKAISRYEDIGKWLGREESTCANHDPHIFPQGSFRMGTAIRPLNKSEEYDLDLACNLRSGISSSSHTQEQLKNIVGVELEKYRVARGVKSDLEEKHRCWRLDYADQLSFHMDIVPCTPEGDSKKSNLSYAMKNWGMDESLSQNVSEYAVGITDDRHKNYKIKSPDWMISNPEGYAVWFESRMQPMSVMKVANEAAQVDEVPIYRRKTPLQRTIQILKRHRDQMFVKNPDSKPISVIITTLAASSYSGTPSLEQTFKEVMDGLNAFLDSDSEQVLNPVNPEENFADRWKMAKYKKLELKDNFKRWVQTASRDFRYAFETENMEILSEALTSNMSLSVDKADLAKILGFSLVVPAIASATEITTPPSKPWKKGE